MSTLGIMKARIADELARPDLTSQIAYAIADAIGAYEDERFYFNESRNVTFSTVASQEFYTASDAAGIATIQEIDYAVVYVGNYAQKLTYERPECMEVDSVNGAFIGTPWNYTWYDEQFRLYPIPDQVYTVRIAASVKYPAPAADDTAGNAWMVKADRLIRSRAKLELALHVLKDIEMADTMTAAVNEALSQLRDRSNLLNKQADNRVRAMAF